MTTRNLSLFHRVRPPLERGEGAPPLLLLLHGYGSHENDLLALAYYPDKRFLADSARAHVVLDQGVYAWLNL